MTAFLSFLLLFSLAGSSGDAPQVTGLEVGIEGQRVLLTFELENAFDQRFRERVESGLPTGFIYQLELLRNRHRWWIRWWFDKTLEVRQLEVMATYDPVAQEYLVSYKLEGQLVSTRVVASLDQLEPAMTRVEQLPSFDLPVDQRLSQIYARVRADLGAKTLFGLIPSRIETGWTEAKIATALDLEGR